MTKTKNIQAQTIFLFFILEMKSSDKYMPYDSKGYRDCKEQNDSSNIHTMQCEYYYTV